MSTNRASPMTNGFPTMSTNSAIASCPAATLPGIRESHGGSSGWRGPSGWLSGGQVGQVGWSMLIMVSRSLFIAQKGKKEAI